LTEPSAADATLSDFGAADPDAIARSLCDTALLAGTAIAVCCRDGRPLAEAKSDGSPVTAADITADCAIRARLMALFPNIPIVSEETAHNLSPGPVFFLVDPLDGTREFVSGGDNWCIAIALVVQGRPVAGAIVAPRLNKAWFGATKAFACELDDDGAIRTKPVAIGVDPSAPTERIALVSRFHNESRCQTIVESLAPARRIEASSAIKFGMIAEGLADVYVRCGPTMEWDVAAGDAIVAAAGGRVCDLDGADLRYGTRAGDFLNPPFVAAASGNLAREICALAQRAS
jgi:3'(2'), 5'-bisphosphate nucleotidase